MATIDLTRDNFEPTVKSSGIVLVDCWAEWCGPCRMFAPVFEKSSEKHPDMVFGKMDTEQEQELAMALQIRSIPTLMIFRDGILLFRQPGALPEAVLEDLITQVQALDMEEVRTKVEEARKQEEAGQ